MSAKGAPRGVRLDARLHILIPREQHRRAKIVAAASDSDVSDIVRSIVIPEIDRRYRALKIGGGEKGGGS